MIKRFKNGDTFNKQYHVGFKSALKSFKDLIDEVEFDMEQEEES